MSPKAALSLVRLTDGYRYFKRLKLDYPTQDTTRASRRFVKAMKPLQVSLHIPPWIPVAYLLRRTLFPTIITSVSYFWICYGKSSSMTLRIVSQPSKPFNTHGSKKWLLQMMAQKQRRFDCSESWKEKLGIARQPFKRMAIVIDNWTAVQASTETYIFTYMTKTGYLIGLELMRRKKGMLRAEKRRLHMICCSPTTNVLIA